MKNHIYQDDYRRNEMELMDPDPFIISSFIANIATIIGLVISVISLRKSLKESNEKIDTLIQHMTKAGVIVDHSIIDQLHVHGDVNIK